MFQHKQPHVCSHVLWRQEIKLFLSNTYCDTIIHWLCVYWNKMLHYLKLCLLFCVCVCVCSKIDWSIDWFYFWKEVKSIKQKSMSGKEHKCIKKKLEWKFNVLLLRTILILTNSFLSRYSCGLHTMSYHIAYIRLSSTAYWPPSSYWLFIKSRSPTGVWHYWKIDRFSHLFLSILRMVSCKWIHCIF